MRTYCEPVAGVGIEPLPSSMLLRPDLLA